jgi:predicted dithiol-disulfide oxidoreductase (DUF899 family)
LSFFFVAGTFKDDVYRGFAVGQTFLVFRKGVVRITVEPAFARLRGGREPDARQAEAYFRRGEQHALSVFFRIGDEVFHTYATYARGTERLTDAYSLLDTTPYGRQEDFEDSPSGWPQRPTYG